VSILGLYEVANPLLTILPIVLMISSGYAIGIIISKVRRKADPAHLRDFIYGSAVLNFLFLSGFMIFGVLSYAVNEYFTAFTYGLVGLTIISAYFLVKKPIMNVTRGKSILRPLGQDNLTKTAKLSLLVSDNKTIFILTGMALAASVLVYQAIIIYYHPIYSEYDSIYRFLPISKSILLGNGLNHDFYLGSDVNMLHPPFTQAINAWLTHSFEYSSIRMFPFYYVLLAAVIVYSLARNIWVNSTDKTSSSFLALIAVTVFSITPALLVVSSRFSLQQDLAFVFILTLSFYLLSEIVRYAKPSKTTLLILTASLALMSLTREIGLVIAIALFFLVPAIKYTEGNLKLRALFTLLSLVLFYVLSFKDIIELGFTPVATIRIIVLVLVNMAIFYLVYQQKNQNSFSSLVRPLSNLKYISPIVIPVIFIGINTVMIMGPYPVFTFSSEFTQMLPAFRQIFDISNPLTLNISQALENLPRIDILFISLAAGSTFIFFKLLGISKIIYQLKSNNQYSLVLILLIFLICTWSFLLQSRYEGSDIRYVTYFVPLLSIIMVIGISMRNVSSQSTKIFFCAFIVLATYYFLHNNLFIWNYNEHFGGFWIEPNIRSIMNWEDFRFAAVVLSGLLITVLVEQKLYPLSRKYHLYRYSILVLTALIIIQVYNLSTSGILLASPQMFDKKPPSHWETNVIEVVNYLNNNSEQGNVLSVRAPAIPFFTNRTSFDIFSPQTFAYTLSPLLSTGNSSDFKEKIEDLGIRYIVVPKEVNPFYYSVINSNLESILLPIINDNDEFDKIVFKDFNVYKYNPPIQK
jgi:hypothetical protein